MRELLLTSAQAAAVYGAMCAMNNFNGLVDIRLDEIVPKRIYENYDGTVVVVKSDKFEHHVNQDAFAKAYSIVN